MDNYEKSGYSKETMPGFFFNYILFSFVCDMLYKGKGDLPGKSDNMSLKFSGKYFDLLDEIKECPCSKEHLVLRFNMDVEEVSEILEKLIKEEFIYKEEELFHINSNTFVSVIDKLQEYCTVEEDGIYQTDTRKALSEHFFAKRENGFLHAPFERELAFYESVRSGSLETVKTLFTPLGGEGFGILCDDELRNLKYHLVISIAIITRFCINGGMPPESAYSLSDVYIRKTDKIKRKEDINSLHYEMVIAFTKEMRQIHSKHVYSKTVILMLDYISDHLHDKILVQDIAASVKCSIPYLSRLFHAEMGIPLSTYIMRKKIESAANMLQFSTCSSLEISNYLHFSSQSYFIKQFKKIIGMTPKEYRDKYYTVNWMNSKLKK